MGKCDKIISVYRWEAEGIFSLPVRLEKTTYVQYELRETELPENAAEKRLRETLLSQLGERLGKKGEMLSGDFKAVNKNGWLAVTLRAECREHIGVPREID